MAVETHKASTEEIPDDLYKIMADLLWNLPMIDQRGYRISEEQLQTVISKLRELRAARAMIEAIDNRYTQEGFCGLGCGVLYFNDGEVAGWLGHKGDCPLTTYSRLVEEQAKEMA